MVYADRPHARPQSLFKYLTFDTACLVLGSGSLRWSTPATLRAENDPFELSLDSSLESFTSVLVPHFSEMLRSNPNASHLSVEQADAWAQTMVAEVTELNLQAYLALQEAEKQKLGECTILCLTADPANHAMWTHYGDRHKGIVLEFSTSEEIDDVFSIACPVIYADEMPSLYRGRDALDFSRIKPPEELLEWVERAVYTKPKTYAFEQEWRIYSGFDYKADGWELRPFKAVSLQRVIVGATASEASVEKIAELVRVKYPSVAVCQMRQLPSTYVLEY